MTETSSPEIDPQELKSVTLSNSEISNLLACIDAALRGQGLQAAETCLALATKLSSAKPIKQEL